MAIFGPILAFFLASSLLFQWRSLRKNLTMGIRCNLANEGCKRLRPSPLSPVHNLRGGAGGYDRPPIFVVGADFPVLVFQLYKAEPLSAPHCRQLRQRDGRKRWPLLRLQCTGQLRAMRADFLRCLGKPHCVCSRGSERMRKGFLRARSTRDLPNIVKRRRALLLPIVSNLAIS